MQILRAILVKAKLFLSKKLSRLTEKNYVLLVGWLTVLVRHKNNSDISFLTIETQLIFFLKANKYPKDIKMALIIIVLNLVPSDVNVQLTGVYAIENELLWENFRSQKTCITNVKI